MSKNIKKLSLNRETVTKLSNAALTRVGAAGGKLGNTNDVTYCNCHSAVDLCQSDDCFKPIQPITLPLG